MTDTPSSATELTDEIAGWMAAYRRATDQATHWKAAMDRAKEHIINALAASGATIGTIAGRPVVRCTTITTHRIDVAELRRQRPDIAAEYSVSNETHRFNLLNNEPPSD